MAVSNSYIFSTLQKFSDGDATDLNAFLSKFDRCCVVANKVDADVPIKGQLLMLFVEGRARAALEEFELSNGGQQQTYAALVAKLKEYFDSAEARETSMTLFEARVKKINESEEEFMLQLLRLYQTANPDHDAAVTLLAIKRKFLAGISPLLRGKIFVFCSAPFENAVTRENLLSHCRKARNLLNTQQANVADPSSADYSTDRVLMSSNEVNLQSGSDENPLVAALNNLSMRFEEHARNTDRRFDNFGDAIAAVSGGGGQSFNNFRGGRGGRGYNNRGNYVNNNNRNNQYGGNNRGGNNNPGNFNNRGGFNNNRGGFRGGYRGNFRGGYRGGRRCFNCNSTNHLLRDCTAPGN